MVPLHTFLPTEPNDLLSNLYRSQSVNLYRELSEIESRLSVGLLAPDLSHWVITACDSQWSVRIFSAQPLINRFRAGV